MTKHLVAAFKGIIHDLLCGLSQHRCLFQTSGNSQQLRLIFIIQKPVERTVVGISFVHMEGFHVPAVCKGIVLHDLYGGRNCHLFKIFAVSKCFCTDFFNSLRQDQPALCFCFRKRLFPDGRHCLGKRNLGQTTRRCYSRSQFFVVHDAVVCGIGRIVLRHGNGLQFIGPCKGTGPDLCHTGRNMHLPKGFAAVEGTRTNLGHSLGNGHFFQYVACIKRKVCDGVHGVGDLHLPQAVAMTKRPLVDRLQILGKLHLFQLIAVVKSIVTDLRHTVRQCCCDHVVAIIKNVSGNGRHAIFHDHAFDILLAVFPRHSAVIVIVHGAGAGDGQRAVFGQAPFQFRTAGAQCDRAVRRTDARHCRAYQNQRQQQTDASFEPLFSHILHFFLHVF